MSFTTAMGKSQHMRQVHPAEYNQRTLAGIPKRNRLWSDEERTVLALKELEAIDQGIDSKQLNRHLASVFLGRTYDAIRCQRVQPKYMLIRQNEVDRRRNANAEVIQEIVEEVDLQVPEQEPQAIQVAAVPNVICKALVDEIQKAVPILLKKRTQMANGLAKAAKVFLRSAQNRQYRLMDWLNQALNRTINVTSLSSKGKPVLKESANSAKRRRHEFAYVQNLFKRSSKRAAEYILNPVEVNVSKAPTQTDMFDFWENIYKGNGYRGNAMLNTEDQKHSSEAANRIWSPITVDDIKASELNYGSAPGPDGVKVKQWRSLPRDLRCTIYNIILADGRVDPDLLQARTVFVPKGDNPSSPGSYRPIGITSVIIRQLHRILARRLRAYQGFDNRQKANTNADGTAENLLLLKAILEDAQHEKRELHLVSIDIRKAFDSVSHCSVLETFKDIGCPAPFVQYMKHVYDNAATHLQYKGQSRKVPILTGVLQGDPLSPIGFNYLMDRPIKALREDIGYTLQGQAINCMAYADDVILVAKTKAGMQHNLDILTAELGRLGLEINPGKSFALSMIPNGKEHKVCLQTQPQFTVNQDCLRQIGPSDTWKYLGVHFKGAQVQGIKPELIVGLSRIMNAPVKPQQKCLLLRNYFLTKYQHQMVLGRVTTHVLETLDRLVRTQVKAWLHLRPDVPNAYIHARHGGLSIPCLSLDIPRMRLERMESFIKKDCHIAAAFVRTHYYVMARHEDVTLLEDVVGAVGKEDVNKYWEARMDETIDTKGLSQSKHCSQSSSFIWSNAHRITGRDYVHYHQLRSGCLPTRSRRLRGCDGDNKCRHGCAVPETNYHVVQCCPRTHGGRILRHNRVLRLLIEDLEKQNKYDVFQEQRFHTSDGLKIPDLIITDGTCAMLIDVQVVGSESMDTRRDQKIDKYQSVQGLAQQIMYRYKCKCVVFKALTISYKGVFERGAAELLKQLCVSHETLYRISTSVLLGGWLNWFCFNKQYFVPTT